MPHILLKFIGRSDWAESFLDGHLYMNSLYYFWNEYPLEVARREKEEYLRSRPKVDPDSYFVPFNNALSRSQADMLEGTIGLNDLVNEDFGDCALQILSAGRLVINTAMSVVFTDWITHCNR